MLADNSHSCMSLSTMAMVENVDNPQFRYGIKTGQVSVRKLSTPSKRLTQRHDKGIGNKRLQGPAL